MPKRQGDCPEPCFRLLFKLSNQLFNISSEAVSWAYLPNNNSLNNPSPEFLTLILRVEIYPSSHKMILNRFVRQSLKNTANGKCETEFLLPKGIQRFHFVGGAKFVHGGAMLQEICVPVLTVKELQKEQAAKHQKSPVPVVVANQSIKLVNNIDKVKFIQAEPVGEKFTPRQLNIFIINADKQLVSSQETITFDSDSPDLSNRTREATLKLIGSQFDRNAKYTLILQNTDTSTEYSRYNVTIDLAFQDDFF
jgi:hypothetical protein